MFCSTVIATINRPTLAAAVISVLEQDLVEDEFEVIVVNDSGAPLPGYPWAESRRVTVIDTQKRERSVARNAGAAVAKGEYLHFLDGDDELLPGALRAFWRLKHQTNADWLYGCYHCLDRDGHLIADHRPDVSGDFYAACLAGELVPLQASLLRSDRFHEVGGFDPTFVIVEDHDLYRRFSWSGYIAGTGEFVARIRTGREGSTGNWSVYARQELLSREKTLDAPGAFSRLETATGKSSYWRGRVGRIFAASLVHNLKNRQIFAALDRFAALMALTRHYVLSPAYWRGFRRLNQFDPADNVPQTGPAEQDRNLL